MLLFVRMCFRLLVFFVFKVLFEYAQDAGWVRARDGVQHAQLPTHLPHKLVDVTVHAPRENLLTRVEGFDRFLRLVEHLQDCVGVVGRVPASAPKSHHAQARPLMRTAH